MAANRLTFKAVMAQVSVPATSANLGPGFDTFGIALELRDRYAAIVLDTPDFDVDVTGEGASEIKKDKNNLVIKAMMRGFEFMGQKPKGIELRQLNAIPHSRGLGSSAAAIVGGLSLARNLVLSGDELLPDEVIIELGTEMEGHPDNVAAALLGNATIAWTDNQNKARALSIPVNSAIKCVAFIPESHLSTKSARKLLPASIPHADAVRNSANTALLTQALQYRPDLLLSATSDYLHQNYRREAMPKSLDLVDKLRAAGVPAMVSGAGPSVLVLHNLSEAEESEFIKVGGASFKAHKLGISPRGVE